MNTPIEIAYDSDKWSPGVTGECHWKLQFELAVELHFTGIKILLDK